MRLQVTLRSSHKRYASFGAQQFPESLLILLGHLVPDHQNRGRCCLCVSHEIRAELKKQPTKTEKNQASGDGE